MFSRRAESLLERMKATITRKSGSAIRITDEDGKLFVDIQYVLVVILRVFKITIH